MLLTRSPLSPGPKPWFSLDLHVLSAPPAFVLSQDQTLRERCSHPVAEAPVQPVLFELELKVSPLPARPEGRRVTRSLSHARAQESLDVHAVEFSKTEPFHGRHRKAPGLVPEAPRSRYPMYQASLEGLSSCLAVDLSRRPLGRPWNDSNAQGGVKERPARGKKPANGPFSPCPAARGRLRSSARGFGRSPRRTRGAQPPARRHA